MRTGGDRGGFIPPPPPMSNTRLSMKLNTYDNNQSYTFTIATKIYPLPPLIHSCRIPSPTTLSSQSNNTSNKRILDLTDANEWITNKCSECMIRHLSANPLVHIRQKEKNTVDITQEKLQAQTSLQEEVFSV